MGVTILGVDAKPDDLRILGVGAHPDDLELGWGGTTARYKREGAIIHYLVASRGEKGNHDTTSKECEAAAEVLGVDHLIVLNFKDTMIGRSGDVVEAIREYIMKFKPHIIYTHSREDRHQDHEDISKVTSSAAKDLRPNIYHFESPSYDGSFSPTNFVHLTITDIEKKIEALSCYQSQLRKGSILNLEGVRTRAKLWGYHESNGTCNGDLYVEAFETKRAWR